MLHSSDLLILIAYITGIFILSWLSFRKNKNQASSMSATDRYLASKSLSFTESISSIIATEVSALTFLGLPAFAYDINISFVQIYIGAIFGRILIALIFLPKVYDQGLTIYEVMAKYSGLPSGRRAVGSIYAIGKILSVGVRLFSGCILVSQFLDISIYSGILLVTILTSLYTLIGGLKAVVRTDMIQMILFIFGGLVAHYLIPEISNHSWKELMLVAQESNKLVLVDFSNPSPFVYGVLGGFLFDMSTHGVDQDFVQRLTATKSLRTGQASIVLSSFLSIGVGLLFLGVGALLFAHYQLILPEGQILPVGVEKSDQLFAYFIVEYFPAGIKGLMVAGVLAATMSTLDSTINALSATLYNDILGFSDQNADFSKSTQHSMIISILLALVALIASSSSGMLTLGLKIQSWTGGSLLGIFVTTVLLPSKYKTRLDWKAVVLAYSLGTIGVGLNVFWINLDWKLNVYFGCFGSLMALQLLRILSSREEQQ